MNRQDSPTRHIYVTVDTSTDWKRALPSLFRRFGMPFVVPTEIHYVGHVSHKEIQL